MPEVYHAATVIEAVELATKFKNEGRCNWFRGQVKDWPLRSSLARASFNEKDYALADKRYGLFCTWVNLTPELKYLLEPVNAHLLESIMQHYGIPTEYIDFTTEPGIAGFFACDTTETSQNELACIYCLNTSELTEAIISFKTILPKDFNLELVEVKVDNLWRHEAQKGVFVKVNFDWESVYSLTKIVFPRTEYPSYPTRDKIYPLQKSPLEILLQQYFKLEKSTLRWDKIQEIINMPMEIHHVPEMKNGIFDKAFINPTKVKILPSWSKKKLKAWFVYPISSYDLVGFQETIQIAPKFSIDDSRNVIRYSIQQALSSNTNIRLKAIHWEIKGLKNKKSQQKISEILTEVWNGMRLLPFTNEDIYEACSLSVYFSLKTTKAFVQDTDSQLDIFNSVFKSGMRIGFTHQDKSGSDAYISETDMFLTVRKDLYSLLSTDFKSAGTNLHSLFSCIYAPNRLFEFEGFRSLFARQIIPTQVAWGQGLVIYNPAQLRIFGNP